MQFFAANWQWILALAGGAVHLIRSAVHDTIIAKNGKDHSVLLDGVDEKLNTLINLTQAGAPPNGSGTVNP